MYQQRLFHTFIMHTDMLSSVKFYKYLLMFLCMQKYLISMYSKYVGISVFLKLHVGISVFLKLHVGICFLLVFLCKHVVTWCNVDS